MIQKTTRCELKWPMGDRARYARWAIHYTVQLKY